VTATPQLTRDLQQRVRELEADLRERVESQPGVADSWRAEHAEALDAGRTAWSWQQWSDDRVNQAAVAWVLLTVFVRFCEDNDLVKPVWIGGPSARRQEALNAQLEYFRANPEHTDREWLSQPIDYLATLPATQALVDSHSPLHTVSPSGDAATALLAFWRERDDDGALLRDLTDPERSARFLGDLYQDLSQHAKETYALLQTPEFVEEFILDRTLKPALDERPLGGFRLIDPTCGSGHFLLSAFDRLLDRWHRHAPGLDTQARVQEALNSIHGVDINPFAVAIARFRLTIAALSASGLHRLEEAPAFKYHVAVGDSLLHGSDQHEIDYGPEHDPDAGASGFAYSVEDLQVLRVILQPGRYDVVVGNPPYITPKDSALNHLYRERYETCHRKYALTVPFMERFFQLAKPNYGGGGAAGWVGQITSNSFMKREFGAPLIEKFLSRRDLRLVADTSGAYIPGHGTPTVIVVGRPQSPVSSTVRAVLGIRGEPDRPAEPAKGVVWRSVVDHVDDPGHDDGWTSTVDLNRDLLVKHPWSLSGGGAVDLLQLIERDRHKIESRTFRIGVFGIMGSDEAMIVPSDYIKRCDLERDAYRRLVLGDEVRDYWIADGEPAWFPYTNQHQLRPIAVCPRSGGRLWSLRTELGNRATFSKGTYFTDGRPWFEWHQLPKDKGASPLSITFAFVATHNHFVLDRGGKVFKQSAPVIKFSEGTGEDENLELLGVLNSSTACFWLKQNSHSKGNEGYQSGIKSENWERFWEFTGTTLQDFPLPSSLPLERGKLLDALAQELAKQTPHAVRAAGTPSRAALDEAHAEHDRIRARMIAEQEELDWEVYRLYGLVAEDFTYQGDALPELAMGQRAFEIAMARAGEDTAWFDRHGSTPITELPEHWPEAYRELVQRRLELIGSDRSIGLLERPEHKRRWAIQEWGKREQAALRGWLLDRLEERAYWFDAQNRPLPRTVAQLADQVARDRDLVSVLALWEGRPDVPVSNSLQRLLADEAVPFLAAHRYTDAGLRKRAAWEHTWMLQRREDAGQDVGTIAVPPKYAKPDFRRGSYWTARGKLDVPKERFIGYPDAGRDTDPTPLLGWAGWDHAEQALALGRIVTEREAEGWPDERLVPLVAGLAELQPWVDQWHAELHPTYGLSLASYCAEELTRRCAQVGRTRDELATWRPAPVCRGRPRRTAS
jgi:hypothetical protein